jgi:hypothetical protein
MKLMIDIILLVQIERLFCGMNVECILNALDKFVNDEVDDFEKFM